MKTPIYTGIFQSDFEAAGYRISGLPTPSVDSEAATKAYVDAHAGGGGGSGLDANTVTAASIGMVGDGVTDNTTALQTWLNAVGTAKVNSTLLVPDGVYIFSGPLQDGSRRNAQILLPSVASTDQQYSITIKGYHPIAFVPWYSGHMAVPKGPIFKSTLAVGSGTQPSFIGGMGPAGGSAPNLDFLCVRFENMIFQTVQNPQITCLNLGCVSDLEFMGDVLIIAGNGISEGDTVQPTTSTSYGLIVPPNNFSVLMEADNLVVYNFYTGVFMGELSHVTNLGCYVCVNAVEFPAAFHSIMIERLEDWHCVNGLKISGACAFQIVQHDTELAPAAQWNTRVYDIVDPSNFATADITWWSVTAFTGAHHIYVINGGTGIRAKEIGSMIGTDLRVVQLVGGGKLQARNTGTNTWADVDQWTNP